MLFLPHDQIAMFRLPDDALYYFTIAKQFALGHGISFDGVTPTNGFHPLWLVVMLPLAFVKLAPWAFINTLLTFQTLLDILNIWLIIRLVLQLIDAVEAQLRSRALLIAVISYALNAAVIVRGINGLETTLASFVLLLWLSLYCSLYRDGLSARVFSMQGTTEKRALLRFGLLNGLLFLARTDFAIIELVSVVVLLLLHRREVCVLWRAIGVSALIALMVVLPWLIWNWVTFGSIVQVSANAVPFFAMKKLAAIYPSGGKTLYLIREAARNLLKPFFFTASGISLVAIALPMLQKKRTEFMARLSGSGLLPPLFGALLLIVYHSVARGFIRDWYVLQLLPIVSVVFGAAIAYWLVGHVFVHRWSRLLLIGTLLGTLALDVQEWRAPRYPSQALMLSVAESLENVKERASIGAFNSGYYSFFGSDSVSVQDLDGVVNWAIYPYLVQGNMHRYLDSMGVDALLDFPGTINGYQGLLDRGLTEQYGIKRMIGSKVTTDSLELLSRRKVLFW